MRNLDPLRHPSEKVFQTPTGIARDAKSKKEFADVESQAAHDAYIVVAELRFTSSFGALLCSEPVTRNEAPPKERTGRTAVPAGISNRPVRRAMLRGRALRLRPDRIIDEGVIEFRLQMQVFGEVEPQDEAHFVTGLGRTGPESVFSDFTREKGVTGGRDAAADADLEPARWAEAAPVKSAQSRMRRSFIPNTVYYGCGGGYIRVTHEPQHITSVRRHAAGHSPRTIRRHEARSPSKVSDISRTTFRSRMKAVTSRLSSRLR